VRSIGAFDTVAASIGAFIAMDLDDVMIERVIGVALTHSILPYVAKWYERPVPAMKNNMGWVAAGAILSVSLAALGQSGGTRARDGDTGIWRMVGSDRWVLEDDLVNGKPAVLRTGFKYFPACWHIQEYLKTFSALLAQVPTDDEVLDIVVAGPADIEKFCHGNLGGAADIAFSLPA